MRSTHHRSLRKAVLSCSGGGQSWEVGCPSPEFSGLTGVNVGTTVGGGYYATLPSSGQNVRNEEKEPKSCSSGLGKM